MLAILGELCWLEVFKTVYLETFNVQFGLFFQTPVTNSSNMLLYLASTIATVVRQAEWQVG